VPDRHGAGQVGAATAVPLGRADVAEAVLAEPGESADVLGRPAGGFDVECGGARQPPVPERVEDNLPGADEGVHHRPDRAGPAVAT